MGKNHHDKLHTAEISTVGHKECQTYHSREITKRMLCVLIPSNHCAGDSSDLFVCKNKLYGIGSQCGNNPEICTTKCGQTPDIFARAASVRKWIFKTTGVNPEPKTSSEE